MYVSPGTTAAYRNDGKFPDSTVLVKEVHQAATKQMTTGTISLAERLKGWFRAAEVIAIDETTMTTALWIPLPAIPHLRSHHGRASVHRSNASRKEHVCANCSPKNTYAFIDEILGDKRNAVADAKGGICRS